MYCMAPLSPHKGRLRSFRDDDDVDDDAFTSFQRSLYSGHPSFRINFLCQVIHTQSSNMRRNTQYNHVLPDCWLCLQTVRFFLVLGDNKRRFASSSRHAAAECLLLHLRNLGNIWTCQISTDHSDVNGAESQVYQQVRDVIKNISIGQST